MLTRARGWRTGFVVVVAAALIGLAACDWTQPRFDEGRTANNPISGLSTSNVSRLRVAWSVSAGEAIEIPLVAGGIVLATGAVSPNLPARALNISDGSIRWTSSFPFDGIDNGVAYGVGPSGLTAVSLNDGRVLWSATTTGYRVLGATNGKVFVLGADTPRGYYIPYVQVWDASTHRVVWTFPDTIDQAPAVANGTVFFARPTFPPEPANTLHALDEASGKERWSIPQPSQCPLSSPVVSAGYVFWAGATFKARDGSFVANWPFCPPPGADSGVVGTTVFAERPSATAGRADFVSFDGTTGAVHWSYGISTGVESSTTFAVTNPEPVIGNDVVFAWVNGGTVGFNTSTGQPVALLGGMYAESAANGTLFAAGTGTLTAFRPA